MNTYRGWYLEEKEACGLLLALRVGACGFLYRYTFNTYIQIHVQYTYTDTHSIYIFRYIFNACIQIHVQCIYAVTYSMHIYRYM